MDNLIETSSRMFFKSMTIAGTASSIFMLGDYIGSNPILSYIYIAIGIALGSVITFYVYPNFSESKDTKGLLVAIAIVSIVSYIPSSTIIYKWAENKIMADISVPKGNIEAYNKAFAEYTKLKTEREDYIQEPLKNKAKAQSKKMQLDRYHANLQAYNNRKKAHIKRCNQKWRLPSYKTKNRECRAEFIEPKPILGVNIITNYKQFDKEYNQRAKSDYNLAKIATQKEIMSKNDPKPYREAVSKAKNKLPSFYIVVLLVFLLGLIIESLGELPYFFQLRREAISKKPTKKAPIVAPREILLKPINNIKTKPHKIEKKERKEIEPTELNPLKEIELTELNLLKERFRNVNIGDRLVSKNKLPFEPSNKLNQMVTDLNKKLKEIGAVEGTTHLKATKTYEEVLKHVS